MQTKSPLNRRRLAWLPLLYCVLSLLAGTAAAREVSGPAPDFTLQSRSGENLKLSEFRGEVVMINFWASWCGPCRQEMPLLDELYRRYHPMGFTILGINVEQERENALRLLEEIPVSFPILFDSDNRVAERYALSAMPSTVMVDRDGNLRFVHLGYLPGYEDEYEAQIKQLLRE